MDPYKLIFYFKSQHNVVVANYGLSVAVFGFGLAVIVFEILPILWKNGLFFQKYVVLPKNRQYLKNYNTYDKSENSNREPVVSSNNGER